MNTKKKAICIMLMSATFTVTSNVAFADCAARLDEIKALQSKTPYLDEQRPDLSKMRRVAEQLMNKGRESLCLELVEELKSLTLDHREHAAELNALENYASAVPVTTHKGRLTTEHLIDMPVRNRVGEELGEVRGFDIAPDTGKIEAVKVIHGGFMGLGEKTVIIPWEQFHLSLDSKTLVLDMTEKDIAKILEIP